MRSNIGYCLLFSVAFWVFSTMVQAQSPKMKSDVVEMLGNKKVKIYLDDDFRMAYKPCADYYLVTEFKPTNYSIKDSIKIYYKDNNQLYLRGIYKDTLHGYYQMFHKNGKFKKRFSYANGIRVGTWTSYYNDGRIYKKVFHKKGYESLLTLYDKNGKQLVRNGNGHYKDSIYMASSDQQKFKITGEVKNGGPEGEWTLISPKYLNVSKEYYKNSKFIKGVFTSKKGVTYKYTKAGNAMFTGVILFEHLNIGSMIGCGYQVGSFPSDFVRKFRDKLQRSALSKKNLQQWFFIEIKWKDNTLPSQVNVMSYAPQALNDQIKELVVSIKNLSSYTDYYNNGHYFGVIVVDGKRVYGSKSNKTKLFRPRKRF